MTGRNISKSSLRSGSCPQCRVPASEAGKQARIVRVARQ